MNIRLAKSVDIGYYYYYRKKGNSDLCRLKTKVIVFVV